MREREGGSREGEKLVVGVFDLEVRPEEGTRSRGV